MFILAQLHRLDEAALDEVASNYDGVQDIVAILKASKRVLAEALEPNDVDSVETKKRKLAVVAVIFDADER